MSPTRVEAIAVPLVVVAALVLATAGTAAAQPTNPLTYEMTLDGLTGSKKATTLTIESWSWGAMAHDPSELEADAGTAKGKHSEVHAQAFYFNLEQTPVSAQLVEAMVGRKVIAKVTVRSKQLGSGKTFELVLKDVRIASYQTGGYGGGASESVSLTYKSAKLTVGGGGDVQSADVSGNAN